MASNEAEEDQVNVLGPGEVELYVKSLECSRLEDFCTPRWWQHFKRLQELGVQAALEAQQLRHEDVKETLVSENKLAVLVNEAIAGEIWTEHVWAELQEDDEEESAKNGFLVDLIPHHEAAAVALLSLALYHPDACNTLSSAAGDLADYCCRRLTLEVSRDSTEISTGTELSVQISRACCAIARYLSEAVDLLTPSVASTFLRDWDFPLMLCSLIKQHLNSEEYRRLEAKEEGRVAQTEVQLWLALHSLLLSRSCVSTYDLSDTARRDALQGIKFRLHQDRLVDQIPVMVDLRVWIDQLMAGAVGGDAGGDTTARRVASMVQEVPGIVAGLLKPYDKGWNGLVSRQRLLLQGMSQDERMSLAQSMSGVYSSECIERFLPRPKCVKCGEIAKSRCSRCKAEWYCRRQCQVEHWPKHKKMCDLVCEQ